MYAGNKVCGKSVCGCVGEQGKWVSGCGWTGRAGCWVCGKLCVPKIGGLGVVWCGLVCVSWVGNVGESVVWADWYVQVSGCAREMGCAENLELCLCVYGWVGGWVVGLVK